MAAINYLTSAYGAQAWKSITIYWDGDAATVYRLYVDTNPTPVYTGTAKTYAFTGVPDTRYDFHLEVDIGAVTTTGVITVFTRTLPAPVGLAASSITHSTASLSWVAVTGATTYDVADATDSYTIIDADTPSPKALTALVASTRYSYAVRSTFNTAVSRWSTPITFMTTPDPGAVPGTYTFSPDSIHVWQAGRPGSSSPLWRPEADDWYHGDGFVWGDNAGVQSTFAFFGAADFSGLIGGTVTSFQVYLDRASYGGDPGAVLSRWLLHDHATKPVGQPATTASHEIASFARGGVGWVTLPSSWADNLISGAAEGIAWGGAAERYQVARHTEVGVSPRMGDIKIAIS